MNKLKKIICSEAVQYIIYGILTTVINIISYTILIAIGVNYIISNIVAFIISLIFAFITNKLFVFKSSSWEKSVAIKEGIAFISARLATFAMDMILMILFVSYMNINDFIAKVIANVLVIVANYVLSKLIIFKKN